MNDLKPFVKIAWKSNSIKNEWAETFRVAGQLSFKAEYEMVKQNLRKANVFHMTPQNFDTQIETITKDKLVFLPMLKSKSYSGFSHKHFPIDKLDMDSFVYGVVTRDLETANKFVEASKHSDHVTQGQLLGYPKCCCEAFQNNWLNKHALDPCYEAAINTLGHKIDDDKTMHVKGYPLLNSMLRYFGIKISPFFPCNFKCDNALKVGETWFKLMKSMDEDVANKIEGLLNQPLTWSLHKSIIYIKTPQFLGVVNGYDCENKDVIWNE
jgi:hypothetical protein